MIEPRCRCRCRQRRERERHDRMGYRDVDIARVANLDIFGGRREPVLRSSARKILHARAGWRWRRRWQLHSDILVLNVWM